MTGKALILAAFLPIGILLFIQSLGWPHNFDDFYRGFNGISPDHDVLGYGWFKSQEMLKHVVHDPLLTWSNQLDYRMPVISGLAETTLLVGLMSIISRKAISNGNRQIAFAMILLFNLFVGVQAYTFLPPAAFPLAFSITFAVTILSSLRFDALGEDEQLKHAPHRSWRGKVLTLVLIAMEQLAFLFYASNFVQSIMFWGTSNLQRTLRSRGQNKIGQALTSLHLWSGLRYIPFVIVNLIWRSRFGANGSEKFSQNLNIPDVIISALRWDLAGTNLGGYVGMKPKPVIPWEQPAWVLAISILIGGLSFVLAYWIVNREPNQEHQRNTVRQLTTNAWLLGVSIVIGWTIPALSERYYDELIQFKTQTYVASRYAGLGFLITLAIPMGMLLSRLKPKQWQVLMVVVLISSISTTQNIASLRKQANNTTLRLSDVCAGQGDWNQKLLFPKPIIAPGVDTSQWLTSYKNPPSEITMDSKKRAAMDLFERNSMRFCR